MAGFDISSPKDDDSVGYACMVVMTYPDMKVVYKDSLFVKIDAPYCPGFLAFKYTFTHSGKSRTSSNSSRSSSRRKLASLSTAF